MKLRNFELQRCLRGMYVAAAVAGLSLSAGWGAAWAAPVNTFNNTVQLPTPIYLGGGDAVPVPADYTGDGRGDLAVYSESSGMWYVRTMGMKRVYEMQLGGPGYRAYPADYDGDGKADLAVYGNGVWGAALSTKGYAVSTLELGASGSTPVPADYDGDGKADPAVYRESDGQWSVALSTRGYAVSTLELGASGFAPVPADYDGDGKADPAVYSRTLGLWAAALSSRGYAVATHSFNVPDATPVVGDFDGDGKTDLAIYHNASGLWLGRMSGSGYALSYQMLGGGDYVPVSGRFYHKQRHTFGVYNPSTGAWLVQYTPALVGDGEGLADGIFGSILSDLAGGIPGDVVTWGVSWLLDLLTGQNSGEQEQQEQQQQQLNSMDASLITLLGMSATLESQLSYLTNQLSIDVTDIENTVVATAMQGYITTIQTHYDNVGAGNSMGDFYSSTFTNVYPDTNSQYNAVSSFAGGVAGILDTYGIDTAVIGIDGLLMPSNEGLGQGLMWGWTAYFIENATADNLYDCYQTLETYYAGIYSWMMKGAATFQAAINFLRPNTAGQWVSQTLTPKINAEVDQFEQCTYQLLLSQKDFVNDFSQNAAFVPRVAATNILARNMFMAAQARGTNAYGLNAMILATMDAVTNGMPPIVAFYDWMPSPEVNQRGPDTDGEQMRLVPGQPAVQYFYPVTSRWISVTGPAYDYWSNGRMHATNEYAFLQYGFGTNLPFGNYVWQFSPSQPWNPAQQYGGGIKTGRFDDSLNQSPTGNVYGFFLAQLRNGGPAAFAGNGMAPFSYTTNTHQVLGNTSKQGATMQITGQYPAGTNVVVVSVAIANGPLDNKHCNNNQGDITVNAHALWSFTYDGPPITGALKYQAATSGNFKFTPPAPQMNVPYELQTASFTGRVDVIDQTTGVSTSGVVKSYSVNNYLLSGPATTIPLGTNTPPGSLTIQFQPGHAYQVRAGWDCSMHDSYDSPVGNNLGIFLYPFALDVTLTVQGLAITFD